jgi:hypothetical protein
MTKPEAVAMVDKFLSMLTYIYPSIKWNWACPPEWLYTVDGSIDGQWRWSFYVMPPEGEDCDADDKYTVSVRTRDDESWTF